MENLTIKTIKPKSKISENSVLVKFFCIFDNLEMELLELERDISFKINARLKKEFYDKETGKIEFFPSNNIPSKVILYKLKENDINNSNYFRNTLAGLVADLKKNIEKNILISLPENSEVINVYEDLEYLYQTAVEGICYGCYKFDKYKSDKKKKEKLSVSFISDSARVVKKAVENGIMLSDSVAFARDLVNEPAMGLTPQELSKRTKSELTKAGVKVKILNKAELQKRKMGGVLAVGQGSSNPPQMIIMEYKPKVKAKKKIALVGKGVTFDTGGYSLKPENFMLGMEADMGGAAGVIGATLAIAKAKLPVEVITIVPTVENCVSGNAYKPGDIVKTSSGKSILVLNTDAEGRIILADALELASKQKADFIIDMATLTGANEVALGGLSAGMYTKNEKLIKGLSDTGFRSQEKVWPMPMWDDYSEFLKTDKADIKNLGPRYGGAITAAKFLEFFVDDKENWAHLDIPSPSPENKLTNYQKKYHSAYGVRLLFEFAKKLTI
ncbi:MAG: M17 family metallopeptidase [Rhodothermaceae bacterium]